ncbi:ABC transporter permease [Sanguibacter sp. HDW7]|uniref:ABC transporter permease n=1 Tax=Sanguibacter sp. HDW7 TaxID=2714931 RepID=UPI00140A2DB3|nr:ABC transporter permease [Sanguibacter sp. HDW7]QIK83376.1 ABC transporter permease [Sanguibacter sp. HDW7]
MTAPAHPGAAPVLDRLRAQTAFELASIFRNGEQIMVTILMPLVALVALAAFDVVDLARADGPRVDLVAPGVLAMGVMAAAFTSPAIATSFDRRGGVLRLLATTPLGRVGLLGGKVCAVLVLQAVQAVVLGGVAVGLGWRPAPLEVLVAAGVGVLGTAVFTALAMLVAGTLRFEAVLALANILLIALTLVGGVLVPTDWLPGVGGEIARLLPSGALGEALRGAFGDGVAWRDIVTLLGWTGLLTWATNRTFRWS